MISSKNCETKFEQQLRKMRELLDGLTEFRPVNGGMGHNYRDAALLEKLSITAYMFECEERTAKQPQGPRMMGRLSDTQFPVTVVAEFNGVLIAPAIPALKGRVGTYRKTRKGGCMKVTSATRADCRNLKAAAAAVGGRCEFRLL